MDGICYIIAAGRIDAMTLEPGGSDFVIAADAGYLHLAALAATADLVVGDFDSMTQKPNHLNLIVHPVEKDKTDTILAIDEGLRRGYRKLVILGGLGGRLDHTLANIQALSYIAEKGGRGYLLGGGTAVTVIRNGSISFDSEKKGTISVFCCGDSAQGVNLRGLKYELSNATLTSAMPLGVSNKFTGVKSEVSVVNGFLAVMWEESAAGVIDSLKEA
jgi:thiamine pyrophosphokinase